MYITTESVKSEQAVREDSAKITIQATGATSWRRADVKYRKNEAFVDVIENVNLLMSNKGTVLRADVDGQILMRAYLSGMPECKFGLNDKLVLDRKRDRTDAPSSAGDGGDSSASGSGAGAVELDDCQFHQCVKLNKYDTDRSISFTPPDGEFELMRCAETRSCSKIDVRPLNHDLHAPPHRYRSTTNVNIPFKVHPIVEEIGKSRVEYTVHLKANFDPKLTGSNVVMRIPTPPNTTSVKCEVGFGKAKWVSSDNAIVWKIPRIQGMSDASLQAEATLSQVTVRKAWSRPPIEMDFQVLMLTASGESSEQQHEGRGGTPAQFLLHPRPAQDFS